MSVPDATSRLAAKHVLVLGIVLYVSLASGSCEFILMP